MLSSSVSDAAAPGALSVRKDERFGGQRSRRIALTVETSANARSLTPSDNIGTAV
jgi:hypothetical protein